MKRISAQDLASYAAVIVASVALYVGWDQARIGRNQQHADVFPVVQFESQYVVKKVAESTVRHLVLRMSNEGVGPAFIESNNWSIFGQPIEKVSQIANMFPENLRAEHEYQGVHENFLLAAGESEVMWEVTWPNTAESRSLINEFMRGFWSMELEVCYCSLYERCWITQYRSESPRPKAVKSCPK